MPTYQQKQQETIEDLEAQLSDRSIQLKEIVWRGDGGFSYWSETKPPMRYHVHEMQWGFSVKLGSMPIKPNNDGETDYFETREQAFSAASDDMKVRILELVETDEQ